MRLSLVQHDLFDTEPVLKRVGAGLPRDIVERTRFSVPRHLDEADLPHVIATLDDATEEEATLVRAALARAAQPGVELNEGDVVARRGPPAPGAQSAETDLAALLGEDDAQFRSRQAVIEDLAREIRRIIEGPGSGEPFPELAYAGRTKAAYDAVVELLGRVPMEDRGEVLQPGDVMALKKPWRVRRTDWDTVVEHLESEVRAFHFVRDWFGDTGHVRSMLRDQVVLDYDFVAKLNERFTLVGDTTVVELLLGKAMGIAVGKIGKIPTYGEGLSALVSVVWAVAQKSARDPDAKVKGKIREIKAAIAGKFLASIKETEKADLKLSSDWGLLRDFATLIRDGALSWPKDMTALRAANAYAFHYECLRVLVSIRSSNQVPYNHWGIVRRARHSKTPVKARWNPGKGDYHRYSASKEVSDGYSYQEYFLGGVVCTLVPMAGIVCDPAIQASKALQKKLFGIDTGDDTDPDLKLPAEFLDNPRSKARVGWKLDDFGVL